MNDPTRGGAEPAVLDDQLSAVNATAGEASALASKKEVDEALSMNQSKGGADVSAAAAELLSK